MKKKVELLAPAGNYEAFLGAVNAGADAVYLGGERFGARAYADNFQAEEILRALSVAHFYGKKIYLTVNTLLKEREIETLSDYLADFYQAGLDGVIVQDLGVLRCLKEQFPGLSLHASTQMTVTGARGASLLKEAGISRIVPARELSLREVQKIREEADVEVECFIHGAMCYCYSGQCLFSSILGGRSGNRGRCAQPCRLPYEIWEGKKRLAGEGYPLSLKDMCTLEYLPALIGAGIDSFKIEGRMKRPEYAAGVTAVYRKYIDRYYETGAALYRVDKPDLDRLKSLYIRSEIQTGYYERQNGKEMITRKKPGYESCDEALLLEMREAYLKEPRKMPVRMQARVAVDEPLRLRIFGDAADMAAGGADGVCANGRDLPPGAEAGVKSGVSAEVTGETVQAAKNAPLTEDTVKKSFTKTGESLLTVTVCDVEIVGAGFVQVRALNELRRAAVTAFERAVCEARMQTCVTDGGPACAAADRGVPASNNGVRVLDAAGMRNDMNADRPSQSTEEASVLQPKHGITESDRRTLEARRKTAPAIHALVTTLEQFAAVLGCGCARIYVESDLFLRAFRPQGDAVPIQPEAQRLFGKAAEAEAACYLALPYILRKRDDAYLDRLAVVLQKPEACGLVQGFLIRNLEGLAFARQLAAAMRKGGGSCRLVADAGLSCFNGEAAAFLSDYVEEITLPYELNAGEAAHLARAAKKIGITVSLIVYSRIPMMITANCLKKTADRCFLSEKPDDAAGKIVDNTGRIFLKDRKEMRFPVEINCEHCYNVLYNAVPYSLHAAAKEREQIGADVFRYDFTLETGEECRQILQGTYAFSDYTTGHCKRGVE